MKYQRQNQLQQFGIRIATILIAAIMSGCESSGPRMDVWHAFLAGNTVILNVKTFEGVLAYHAHYEERNVRYYCSCTELSDSGTILTPSRLFDAPWENELRAAYAEGRILFVRSPRYFFDGWEAGLIDRDQAGTWKPIAEWKISDVPRRNPAFAVSNDGHYLAIAGDITRLIDTRSMKSMDAKAISAMFAEASKIGPTDHQFYHLTNRAGYLFMMPESMDTNSVFAINGREYSRNRFGVYISAKDNHCAAFPIINPTVGSDCSEEERYQEAGEDGDGELLLLYSANCYKTKEMRITLRDGNLMPRYSVTLPDFDGEYPVESWDPERHRILFYAPQSVSRSSYDTMKPLMCAIWDYKANTMRRFSIDVKQEFAPSGSTFIPTRRTSTPKLLKQ